MRSMYNRYIPNGAAYTRVVEEDAPPLRPPDEAAGPDRPAPQPTDAPQRAGRESPPAEQEQAKKPGLAGLLQGLKLDSLDTGDILLLLILLFLFLEGDDMELIITLGLLLLLGLD